jgi:hypothetical protein
MSYVRSIHREDDKVRQYKEAQVTIRRLEEEMHIIARDRGFNRG